MFEWLFRMHRDLSSLGLWEVLQRRGLRAAANRDPRLLAMAVERCTKCRNSASCASLLAAGRDRELADVCPNVMVLAHLEAMERHAPKKDLL